MEKIISEALYPVLPNEPEKVGVSLAESVLKMGARKIIKEIKNIQG